MKLYISFILFFLISFSSFGQNRDLNFYINNALVYSPLLHKNYNDSLISLLDFNQINTILSNPQINLEASVLFAPIISHNAQGNSFKWVSDGSSSDYTGYDMAFTDGGQYQVGISLQQPLLNKGIKESYFEKQKIEQKQFANQRDLTSHEIEQLVTYQYILCLKSMLEMSNIDSFIVDMRKQEKIMQKLVNNGIYKPTDLMLVQIELSNYEYEFTIAQNNFRNDLYDLNLLCGISDTSLIQLQDNFPDIKKNVSTTSKYLTAFDLDSLRIISEQSIQNNQYKPQLSIYANAGMNSIYLPDFQRFGFSTGILFSWNIYDGGQKKIQEQKTLLELNSISAEKDYYKNQCFIQNQKIDKQTEFITQKELMIQKQIILYENTIESYKKEIPYGDISIIDLNKIYSEFLAKKQELTQIQMEKLIIINSYNNINY